MARAGTSYVRVASVVFVRWHGGSAQRRSFQYLEQGYIHKFAEASVNSIAWPYEFGLVLLALRPTARCRF